MSQLITGAVIAGWYTRVKDGQKEIEIDVQGNWTDPTRTALGVETPSDGYWKADLTVKLNGANFILTPKDDALKSYEIDIACSLVNKFKYVPRLDKDGDIRSREVHFLIHSGMQEGAAKLESYVGHVGDHVGEMKIIYNDQAQLPLEANEPAETPKPRGRRKAVTPINGSEPSETVQ